MLWLKQLKIRALWCLRLLIGNSGPCHKATAGYKSWVVLQMANCQEVQLHLFILTCSQDQP